SRSLVAKDGSLSSFQRGFESRREHSHPVLLPHGHLRFLLSIILRRERFILQYATHVRQPPLRGTMIEMQRFGRPRKPLVPGQTFGALTLGRELGLREGRSWSLVQCVCGAQLDVRNKGLLNGQVTSCGCLRRKPVVGGQRFGRW